MFISLFILIYLHLALSIFIYFCLSIYLSISIYLYLSLSKSIYIYIYIYIYIFLSISSYLYLSIYIQNGVPTNTIPANTGGWCNHQGHPNSLGWWDAPKIPRLVGGFNPLKTVSRDRHFKQCGTWQVCLKPLTRRVAIIIHTSSICAGCIASSMQKRRTHRTRWTVTCCGNRPPGYSNRITMGSYRIARVQ